MGRAAVPASLALSPAATASRRAVRWTLRVAGAGLALFHAGLFAGRVADASIAEPGVGMRWALAALLGALALDLRRRGLPLCRGRSGLVFWLLVLLLHAGALPAPSAIRADELLLVVPAGALVALAAGGLLASAGGSAPRSEPAPVRSAREPGRRRTVAPLARRFAPRPPPAG
jgi:hypothetical protein